MQPRVVILADGAGVRWTAESPKHMAVVDGEPVLVRTVRQLGERGQEDLWLTSHDARYDRILPSVRRFEPRDNRHKLDQFYACREVWSGRPDVVFLYGDVRWSDAALDTVLRSDPPDFAYFQRTGGSRITGKRFKEGFAMRVRDARSFEAALARLRAGLEDGSLAPAHHQVQGFMEGLGAGHFPGIGPHGVEVDDETDDFDLPGDVAAWTEGVARWRARAGTGSSGGAGTGGKGGRPSGTTRP